MSHGDRDHAHPHDHEHDHGHAHPHEHDHSHAHPHEHDHSHTHPHDHDHTHPHASGHPVDGGDPEAHREPLPRGAGRGRQLLLDAFSGIAGDMTIAALVDLGVPFGVVREATQALGLSGFDLVLSSVSVSSIGATHFDVKLAGGGGERHYHEIRQIIADSALGLGAKQLAQRIFRILAEAEAAVHRIDVEQVHFHEVGALDAIVDIVGAAACFDYLGADVWVTPLPMGRGFVECRHGKIPLPAPATLGCLAGFSVVDAGILGELVTPTGAAIVAGVARPTSGWLASRPLRSGWGAGTRRLADRPNALRVVLAESEADFGAETIDLLEANVDDLTGEVAGHALGALLAAGAVDAWVVPITMKKGRPGWTICALAPHASVAAVCRRLLEETSTIGVRRRSVSRVERPRREIEVSTRYGVVRVKVSEGEHGPAQVKPEFADCQRLAAATGVPVREVAAEALVAARGALASADKS